VPRSIVRKSALWLAVRADVALLWLHRVAVGVLAFAVSSMAAIVLYQICVRHFGSRPSDWTLDVAAMLMVPMTYVAAGYISRQDGHVSVNFVVGALPAPIQRVAEFVSLFAQIVFIGLLTWLGYRGALGLFERGYLSGSSGLPLWPAAAAIPVGGAIFALEVLRQMLYLALGINGKGERPDSVRGGLLEEVAPLGDMRGREDPSARRPGL
jgi:TRAP-type C4-dicarboxylate transport system permease small subunit